MLESQKKSVNTVIDATWFPLISNMRERSARSKDIKGKGQTLTAHFWLSWQVDCHTSDRGCWWPMPSPARKKLSWDEILWNWGGSHSPHGFRCFYHAFIIFYRFIIIFSIKNIIKMAQWRWMLARLSCDHFQPGLQRQLLWLCAPDEPLDHARFIQLMNIYVESGENRWWAIHMDNISIYLSLSLSLSLCALIWLICIDIYIYSTRIYFGALDFLWRKEAWFKFPHKLSGSATVQECLGSSSSFSRAPAWLGNGGCSYRGHTKILATPAGADGMIFPLVN